MTKAKINKDLCIACGACVAMVDDVFDFGEDGLAEAKVNEVPEELVEDVKDAADGCPTNAIEVSEDSE